MVACESKCQGCLDLVKLGKEKNIVTTLIASLKVVETDLQFHDLLVKKEHNRIKDGEIEFNDVHEMLHFTFKDRDVLHLKGGHMRQRV